MSIKDWLRNNRYWPIYCNKKFILRQTSHWIYKKSQDIKNITKSDSELKLKNLKRNFGLKLKEYNEINSNTSKRKEKERSVRMKGVYTQINNWFNTNQCC